MGNINAVVNYETTDGGAIAIIAMDNPPVNALSHALRSGLVAAIEKARDSDAVKAVMLIGTARAFSAGADISEFGTPRQPPSLIDVVALLDAMAKPVIAAISGLALGGGFELALGCHYRVAAPGSRVGLPEVKLGLLPGAGGTQRLPRLVGAEAAAQIIVSGDPVPAAKALAMGALDAVLEGDFRAAALDFTREVMKAGGKPPRVRDRDDKLAAAKADPSVIDRAVAKQLQRLRGLPAPKACVDAVRAAVTMPFEEGQKKELALFMELLGSPESKAQRHVFFAEREAAKLPDMPADTKEKPIARAVVIGAGTMGGGIAMCFANAGIPVRVIETEQAALTRGLDRVAENYRIAISRGSLSQAEMDKRMAQISGTIDFGAVAEGDLVIEAVFEEMDLKRRVFAEIDRLAKQGALLASNTSTLDINEIAAATKRPEDVLGMHFFSPANVMRLLEIVRARKTSYAALATALGIGRRIGKVTSVVGVCDGFVGNRMLARRTTQAEMLLLEGALPWDVDAAVLAFGFPMGPFAMGDLAGLDVGWRIRKARGVTAEISDTLCEAGRFGQKTGAGYYRYEKGSRTPMPDPEVEKIILAASEKRGITRRPIGAAEITERMIYPMINEGARILEERMAMRASDIDIIWIYGYGWPIWRGGPMFYADQVGLPQIRDRLAQYAATSPDKTLKPAPLLEKLAASGQGFAALPVQTIAV
ncbi:MAG: enoyl-CoA hydratase/isomerase family protein [Acidibrevibacterium sp.]|uniref:3-hydroxyacyl-CoA dehydrogenase NAD-binding domain-containing protein n=1 Tax=Acidibrevibacterium fodinaquatile TaxID=1969806 RepID=UPI0023A7FE4B|nr:3-hydroxyacyl-CoA dehydrogenase NAD-binding domain-containing protein [Acidibrevibacterium fodinaquatile]MCA7120305.1 enoyl-CoA hydratase/isomerase family protein [Acidibrevibacterium fodinaquatile]